MALRPQGYIPSWDYNEEDECFEDCILFSCCIGRIDDDIQLIQEAWELLDVLDLSQ